MLRADHHVLVGQVRPRDHGHHVGLTRDRLRVGGVAGLRSVQAIRGPSWANSSGERATLSETEALAPRLRYELGSDSAPLHRRRAGCECGEPTGPGRVSEVQRPACHAPLRRRACRRPRRCGPRGGQPGQDRLAAHQFDAMTLENSLLWSEVHPAPRRWDFSRADRSITWARAPRSLPRRDALRLGPDRLPGHARVGEADHRPGASASGDVPPPEDDHAPLRGRHHRPLDRGQRAAPVLRRHHESPGEPLQPRAGTRLDRADVPDRPPRSAGQRTVAQRDLHRDRRGEGARARPPGALAGPAGRADRRRLAPGPPVHPTLQPVAPAPRSCGARCGGWPPSGWRSRSPRSTRRSRPPCRAARRSRRGGSGRWSSRAWPCAAVRASPSGTFTTRGRGSKAVQALRPRADAVRTPTCAPSPSSSPCAPRCERRGCVRWRLGCAGNFGAGWPRLRPWW